MNFDHCPLLVVWEVTQACDLACPSCRAQIQSVRDPLELTTEEAQALMEEVHRFGNPLLVLTGGDPLKRPDLFDLIRQSAGRGIRTNITPSATPLLTTEAVEDFKNAGIARMAITLDGPNADFHDGFRHSPGNYERAMNALHRAKEIGLETQVHTAVGRHNRALLGEIAQRVFETGARLWSVFFPVAANELPAEEFEKIFGTLYELSRIAPFDIRTAEALHYRRYVAQRKQAGTHHAALRNPGVGEGKGFVFVSHRGEIYPSGFLPVSAGNVRRDSLVETYRHHPMFMALRSLEALRGKCGTCEYGEICGGSRARVYAATGDYLAADPACAFQPQGRPAALQARTETG